MTLAAADGWLNDDDVVAVLVEGGRGTMRQALPISRATADAINEGRIASFNVFVSLELREQLIMARLFRMRERVRRVAVRDPDFGTSYQITVASTGEVDR